MRKKQLLGALLIMSLLIVLALVFRDSTEYSAMKPGDAVFVNVDPLNLERIILKTTATQARTELIKKQGKWVIKNRFEMDADPALMRKFFTGINESKVIHLIDYQEEEFDALNLSPENTVELKFYQKGNESPAVFRLGKNHSPSKEVAGRYVYIGSKKAVVLLNTPLTFVTGQPSVWLRKFLPYHEQVAGVSLYSGDTIVWKTERSSVKDPFSLSVPGDNKKTPQEINQLMFYAMQMRFMDIVPATNDFNIDPSLKNIALYYSTFSGRTFKLSFLAKDKNLLRCSIRLISNQFKTQLVKDYGSDEKLRDELSEWHFEVPYIFHEKLFTL